MTSAFQGLDTSRFSRSMTGLGVPAGATTACHCVSSKPSAEFLQRRHVRQRRRAFGTGDPIERSLPHATAAPR